jgi:ankyrin repeat protein
MTPYNKWIGNDKISHFEKRYIFDAYFEAIKNYEHKHLNCIVRWFPTILGTKNSLGLTGLMQAVASRNYDAIDCLLAQGIDPNVMDKDGWTAKTWAVFMNDQESLKRLRGLTVLTHSIHNDVLGFGLFFVGTIMTKE